MMASTRSRTAAPSPKKLTRTPLPDRAIQGIGRSPLAGPPPSPKTEIAPRPSSLSLTSTNQTSRGLQPVRRPVNSEISHRVPSVKYLKKSFNKYLVETGRNPLGYVHKMLKETATEIRMKQMYPPKRRKNSGKRKYASRVKKNTGKGMSASKAKKNTGKGMSTTKKGEDHELDQGDDQLDVSMEDSDELSVVAASSADQDISGADTAGENDADVSDLDSTQPSVEKPDEHGQPAEQQLEFPVTPKGVHSNPWLLSEKAVWLELYKERLPEAKERGINVNWLEMTDAYNKRMKGVIQRKGEALVVQRKGRSTGLLHDRYAPIRSRNAMYNMSKPVNFTKGMTPKPKEEIVSENGEESENEGTMVAGGENVSGVEDEDEEVGVEEDEEISGEEDEEVGVEEDEEISGEEDEEVGVEEDEEISGEEDEEIGGEEDEEIGGDEDEEVSDEDDDSESVISQANSGWNPING